MLLNITLNQTIGLSLDFTRRFKRYFSILGKLSGESEFGKALGYRSEQAV